MADIGNLNFGVHLIDYTDAEADKIKKKLENLSVSLTIDGKNVSVSNPDSIKKQIEDAIKNVTVQSVKVDTASLATQIQNATSNITSQVKVSFLSGTLATDIQTYLDAKSFKVSISITKSQVQNEVNTAFANVSVPVTVKVSANAAIQQLQQSIANRSISVGLQPKNVQDFVNDIESKLKNKKIKVELEADKNFLVQSVKQALQGTAIKAQVDVNVDASAITRAVQSAINNANFTYNPNGGRRNPSSGGGSNNNWGRTASHGLYESARASVSLGRSLSTNIRIAGELGTVLGNLASVFRIKDILEGVVRIGGQLEQQKIALGSILQDGGKATEMFDKIQSLAVKSPFGIMDLNQYTKQLSAYGIEYNELYDTMKRLADISAGVGVDMGRIILAYGQVRSAGFLKGTELRQFTEANIPLVDKLAERFTKLSGEIVTAGEVYDMISKKKIAFEDVKAVLWDLTDEGGMFNNMQEVLSDSLVAKWKNLSDAVDIMFSKIAEGTTGEGLKSLAEMLTSLTKQWDKLGVAIGTVGSVMALRSVATYGLTKALGSVKGATVAYQRELANLRIKTQKELAATSNYFDKFIITTGNGFKRLEISIRAFTKNFSVLWKSFTATLKGAAMSFLPFAIITGITETIYYFMNKSEESANRIKDASKAASEGYDNLSAKIKSLGNEIPKTTAGILSSIKEMDNSLRDYAPNSGDILNNINKKDKDGNFERSDEERYKMLREALDDTREAYELLGKEMEGFTETANKATDGLFDESLIDNLKDASDEMNEYRSKLNVVASEGRKYEEAVKKAALSDEGYAKAIEGKTLKESLALLKDYSVALQTFTKETSNVNSKTAVAFVSSIKDLQEAQETAFQDSNKFVEKYKALLNSAGFDLNNLTQAQKIAISVDITRFLNSIDGLDDETKKLFTERILEKEFKITLTKEEKEDVNKRVGDPYDESKDEVAKMWKRRAEEIEKAVKMYDQWKKVEGTVKAQSRVKGNEELASLFSGAYGFNLDLENPTKAYEYIQSKLNEKLSAQKKLKIELGVKISDAELKDAQDELKQFLENTKTYIDKTVKGWDLYKKLFEATGNSDLSMNIAFGGNVSFKNKLEELKAKILETMDSLGIGISFDELIKFDTKKLEDAGWTGVSELIKAYNEESRKFKQESIDNFIDIIKASKDFGQQIADIQRKLQKDLKDLRDNAVDKGMGNEELKRREDELTRKANEDISSVRFEEFKKSSDWVKVFDDLDRVSNVTLDDMIAKIEAFAGNAEISQKELKELVEALSKLRKESIERNPFGGLANSISRLKELQLAQQRGLNQNGKYMVRDSTGFHREMEASDLSNAIKAAEADLVASINGISSAFKDLEGIVDPLNKVLDSFGEGADDLVMGFSILSDILSTASSTSNSFSNLMGLSVGKDDKGNAITLADKLGLKNAGLWGAVAGAALGAISSIAGAHDKKLDKAIEKSKQKVKELENAYKNIEDAISTQLGEATRSQTESMVKNLEQQRSELYKQLEAEEDKKKTDNSKVSDYKQQIHQVEREMALFYKNLASEQYGIDLKGWSSQIAKSLTDAFAKGEDAAIAFKRTTSEILSSLVTEMINLNVIQKALKGVEDYLFGANGIATNNSEGGAKITKNEAIGLSNKMQEVEGSLTEAKYIWDALNEATGGALETVEDVAKGGLTKDIQGVTEDTANLLGSYLNAIRQSVHVKQQLLEQLVGSDVPKMNYLAEAQLQQLQMVVANTKRNADTADKIYSLIDRVVDKGGNRLKI